jgi:predicted DNA-binding transcriptional regulator YafY
MMMSKSTRRRSAHMPTNQDSLFRQWLMLRLVPRFPRKITVQALRQALRDEGYIVTDRTVQRDLIELSNIFPLTSDIREKPHGWSWQKDAKNFDLPGLTVNASLTLVLAEQHLSGLLPTSALEQLKPYFDAAHDRLDAEPQPRHRRSWLDKVRTVPPSQPLLAPEIDPIVHGVITEALLDEKQVQISYKKAGSSTPVEYRIHPLALVQRGAVIYLHVRIFDYPDARILALHRIRSATLLDESAVYPDDYQVDESIKAGTWGFGDGEAVKVTLLFQPGCGDHLYETPLATDQKIRALEDKRLEVTATLVITPQFRWWLLGFGAGVEVVAPKSLRSRFGDIAEGMASTYR